MKPAYLCGVAAAVLTISAVNADPGKVRDFDPDLVLPASNFAVSGAQGAARWSLRDGTITGDATVGPGLLPLGTPLQDSSVDAKFRCVGVCDAGLVFRLERAGEGWKGVLVALEGDTVVRYVATFDARGRIASKTKSAPPPPAPPFPGQQPPPPDPASPTPTLVAATRVLTEKITIKQGAWNEIEATVESNNIHAHLNGVRNDLGRYLTTGDELNQYGYGPVALYVGSGSVSFMDIAVKDELYDIEPAEKTSQRWTVRRLSDFYYSWGADVADINRDGVLDIVAGPHYFVGPDYTRRNEIYDATTYNPGVQYSLDMLSFVADWTGDGWPDVVGTERRPFVLYVNPRGEKRRWKRVPILPDVCSEAGLKADLDKDGTPEILYVGGDGRIAFGRPDPADREAPWRVKKVSGPVVAGCNTHGLGAGDLNGDGRMDILYARGWAEQPKDGIDGEWTFHPESFGDLTRSPQHPGGAEMAVYDFNGDGLMDVATSLSAHGWGLAWFEQKRAPNGQISFVRHAIMQDFSTTNAGGVTFSEPHSGATMIDADKDGIMDLIVGKRDWSHLDAFTDPNSQGPAVLYIYHTRRDPKAPGGVRFEPELINNRSGVGSQVTVADVDKDGRLDFVTSGVRGTFLFSPKRR